MTEYRLQESTYPSTYAYHQNRERAPHLEQSWHNGRIFVAVKMIRKINPASISDLGCGDGGLLSVVQKQTSIPCWGYDFCPANAEGWEERGVTAEFADVFNDDNFVPRWGELVVVTEVLEHLAEPHRVVEWIARNAKYIVASSPKDETPGGPCDSHIWAWDWEGYEDLLSPHFNILEHKPVDWSQVISGKSKY